MGSPAGLRAPATAASGVTAAPPPPSLAARARPRAARRALAVLLALGLATPAWAVDRDPWWAPDKALHFAAGAGLAAFGYKVAADGTRDRRIRLIVGAAVALGAGAAKELLDMTGFGTPSWKDFTWDAIGCVVGLALALGIDWAVEHFSQSGSSGGGARLNFFGPVSSP